MSTWTQRGELIYPIGLSDAAKDAIAQAYVDHADLETLADERLMFEKASPTSDDWGATETHRRISTGLFPALADAIQAAIPTPNDGLWYALNDAGELVATNDPDRLNGGAITHGLDWEPGIDVVAGEVLRYQVQLYETLQPHTTQSDWTPDISYSLFRRYLPPGVALPWRQPQGAHDAYPIGARVMYNEQIYVSEIDDNVWAPDVTGWELEQSGDEWVDSGETVVSLVGAGVIRVTDTAPFSAGQQIRINDTEATISYIHTPGAPGILVISPHIPVSGGEAIWMLA